MDEFGKSPLLAITALMTSAALVAFGVVWQPPEDAGHGREAPPQLARLTPAPEVPARETSRQPPRPVVEPMLPGPYASAPMVTIPGPPADADRPAAPATGRVPQVRALAMMPAASEPPSLSGATPPPRPGGKPLPPPPDYAPGPYAPPLVLNLPLPPGRPEPAGVPPAATEAKSLAALPRPEGSDVPSLKGATPPPRPSGKPPPPLRELGGGTYAPPLILGIPTPPLGGEGPSQPDAARPPTPTASLQVAPAGLPHLHGAARPPQPGGKPLPPASSYAPGPYAPALSLTIPSPPAELHRAAGPPSPETVLMLSLVPPASMVERPAPDHAGAPPTPSEKPQEERQLAAIGLVPDERLREAPGPRGTETPRALNGIRLEGVGGQLPPWRRFAALTPPDDGRPMVAIILDDLGLNHRRTVRAVALRTPLTLAILPYAPQIDGWAAQARAAGHELMVHLPMEPASENEDPGPNALLADLDLGEIERRIEWNLARFEGYVGVSNHMGSRFTADERLMQRLMTRVRDRGLLFVDSLTTSASVGGALARSLGVPTATRDIFLDNEVDVERIAGQLDKVERCARRKGYCIAIGHPHAETLEVLERWLPTLDAKGLQLVPISAIIARRMTG